MNFENEARALIRTLEQKDFYAECPCCHKPIRLREAGLFCLDHFTPNAEKLYQQRIAELKARRRALREERTRIQRASEVGARAVNIGFILERIAPSMKAFPFHRNDCRSLFDPIDYVIFEGLSKYGVVHKLIFVDIKTGHARLNQHQRDIRTVVEKKRIAWDTYQWDDDKT